MIPNKFIYRRMPFVREKQFECGTLIYFNHKYVAKWDRDRDRENNDFEQFYNLVKQVDEEDLKYFVKTRKIRVKGISGYGYLQTLLELYGTNVDYDKLERLLSRLSKKYDFYDVHSFHNVGFLNGEPKIYDLCV